MRYGVFEIFPDKSFLLAKRVLLASLLMCLTLLFCPQQAHANKKYASIVIDADSGVVLHERHADKKRYPASLTKVMTLILLFDAIDEGRVGLRDRIKISRHAASMVPSKLDLPVGSSIRVKDAIYALVTKSANDVAVAIAEHLGGTEYNFAKMMTAKARSMGMKDTVFRNASGLHHPRQVSTARDMAKMARKLIYYYPSEYKYFSRQYFTYLGKSYHNHNRLLGKYKGMDGLKTGYVAASGFNLIASAVRSDHRIIGVVFGGRSTRTRNNHMANLLDAGFEKLGSFKISAFDVVPKPAKKPAILRAIASLNTIAPANGEAGKSWAHLNTSLQNGMFSRIVGEGDIDPSASRRIETGLIAIAAHKGEEHAPLTALSPPPSNHPKTLSANDNNWAIQIGAFASRAQTDKALGLALNQLPDGLRSNQPIIVPMKKDNSWLFRARLQGYTKTQAEAACRYLQECIPVKPRT
ncbi:MAG: serine hydrolase [Alphaproteobacteria bacterium]